MYFSAKLSSVLSLIRPLIKMGYGQEMQHNSRIMDLRHNYIRIVWCSEVCNVDYDYWYMR